jgi:hypothetical protein
MSSLRSLLVALSFGVLATGCLARGGAAGATAPEPEEDEDGPIPVMAASEATPPGQQEVAWEDNGVPIRQLTGPGKPHEMKAGEDGRPKLVDLKKKPASPAPPAQK